MTEALGMIECRSFPAVVEAADAAVKAAKVELVTVREDRRRLRHHHRARRRGGGEGRGGRRPGGGRPRRRGRHGARHRAAARQRRRRDAARPRGRGEEPVVAPRRAMPETRPEGRRPCGCPGGTAMTLGKVVGTVVATRKEPTLDGLKFMLVRAVDGDGQETGAFVVAADAVGAGPGEMRPGRVGQFGAPDPGHQQPPGRRRHHGDCRHLGQSAARPSTRSSGWTLQPERTADAHDATERPGHRDHRRGRSRRDLAPVSAVRGGGARHPRHRHRRPIVASGIYATVDEAARAATGRAAGVRRAAAQTARRHPRGHPRDDEGERERAGEVGARGDRASGGTKTRSSRTASSPRRRPASRTCCPSAVTGDHGLTLTEPAPFGVIGAITPSTNPDLDDHLQRHRHARGRQQRGLLRAPAGEAVLDGDGGALLNRAITGAGGPPDVVTCLSDPSIETAQEVMAHPLVRLLVVTGGGAVVKAAMASGKRAICAGPGNPPAVVDETAHIEKAARPHPHGRVHRQQHHLRRREGSDRRLERRRRSSCGRCRRRARSSSIGAG